MSEYPTVLVERQGGTAVVSLNRPDSLNAFDAQLRRDLRLAVREVNDDPTVRVAVLTGGGRAFCAGADLAESAENGEHFRVEDQLNGEYKPILLEMNSAPQPWIAAINGAAAGIGSAFAMNCDLVVMADNAYLYQAFTAIGLVPDGGATWHLVRTLGRKRADEVIVTGEKVSAQKCLEWGLCNRVVAADSLLEETIAWATEIAQRAPLSMRYAKQAVNLAEEQSVGDIISAEAKLQHICINSEYVTEGAIAFMNKRAPVWKDR